MDVMVLQQGSDDDGWTTIGWGGAVDGEHVLLRVDPAGPAAARGRLRVVAVEPHGPAPVRLTAVHSLPQDGWSLVVARTAGAEHPPRPSAEVLARLTDPADQLRTRAAAAPTAAIRGGTTVAAAALLTGPFVAGPEPALGWLCRVFHIDCPSLAAG
jgi:hypothetical protein